MGIFKDRFGLEWLKGGEAQRATATERPTQEGGLPPGMEDTLIAYSRAVLDALKNSPGQTNQTLELARMINVRFDVVIRVLEYLVSKGYVERVSEDKVGNDTVRLTEAGAKLLS